MLKAMVFGHRGFIAWFYAVTWKLLQDFSKRTYGKYITHSLGVFLIIIGMFPILKFMHPMLQFGGLTLILGGMVVFITPFGVEQ